MPRWRSAKAARGAARVDGYRIGGKTGTARKQVGATYAKGKYRALFAGMAPMSNPRLIVAVMIDEPRGKATTRRHGGRPGVRVGHERSLQLLGVPPTRRSELKTPPAKAVAPQKRWLHRKRRRRRPRQPLRRKPLHR